MGITLDETYVGINLNSYRLGQNSGLTVNSECVTIGYMTKHDICRGGLPPADERQGSPKAVMALEANGIPAGLMVAGCEDGNLKKV